ncbi:probable magnesium transporter NIPA6 isoform X2 [Cucumis melo]|uniref:Probable magnesium transporter n=1 Tax=Cucumis melo TaxID=3656 RepID=A0ABM3L865_CUCME|nr:probable magnesium transporter NIPA6 isoform X2 [Cucumis melo]
MTTYEPSISPNDNLKGFLLAMLSSAFIGSSFIIKKLGLRRAGASGSRASSGGYGYLLEPLWWIGMITRSTMIVLHAPGERTPSSVDEIWELAIQPTFLLYTASVIAIVLFLVLYCEPRYGQTNILIYVGICSIIGSLTVMSIKAIGIAIKLTMEGWSQVAHFQTWVFLMVAISCIIIQLNYLNKALDTFDTAVVSPIHYAMFTSFTIFASVIMFKDWSGQSASSIASELCGFVTILSGTVVLHDTRSPDSASVSEMYMSVSPQVSWYFPANGDTWKRKSEEILLPDFDAILKQDHFT